MNRKRIYPGNRRNSRLVLPLTPNAKSLLQRAASVEHMTISAFVLSKGIAAAAETLWDCREFRLPAKRHDAFVAALDAQVAATEWNYRPGKNNRDTDDFPLAAVTPTYKTI